MSFGRAVPRERDARRERLLGADSLTAQLPLPEVDLGQSNYPECLVEWELSIGLWMTFKGFRKDAPLMIEAAASDHMDDSGGAPRPSIGIATEAGLA